MQIQLQPEFDEILQPLGSHALEFFLAASLYPFHGAWIRLHSLWLRHKSVWNRFALTRRATGRIA